MPRLWRFLVPALVSLLLVAVAATTIATRDVRVREAIVGDTVEARVADYVSALSRNDVERAIAAWRLDDARPDAALAARRHDVTASLASLGVRSHRIERIDWWRTCCEPGLTDDPANAGLARVTVEVWTNARYERYVFDVLARTTAYWGDAAGNPPHEWTLRDVYRLGDKPMFARFADPAALYPGIVSAVRDYYDRYRDALLSCDIDRLWRHYPDLTQGMDPERGVNIERVQVTSACAQGYTSASFELEAYAPLRVDPHGADADVSIHGLELYVDRREMSSGGEFLVTLSLRLGHDGWSVVRTDEVTLGEYHARSH